MKRLLLALLFALPGLAVAAPTPVVSGLSRPTSLVGLPDGRILVAGDGKVVAVKDGKATDLATGFDGPTGMVVWGVWVYVADKAGVHRIDSKSGKAEVWAAVGDFGTKPQSLARMAVDERGTLYAADPSNGIVFRIGQKPGPRGKPPVRGDITIAAGAAGRPLQTVSGLVSASLFHLYFLEASSGKLNMVRLSDGKQENVGAGFAGAGGVCVDPHGRVFVSSEKDGKVWGIPRPGEKAVPVADGLKSAADVCYDPAGKRLLVLDAAAGEVVAIPAQIPGWEVDVTPLALETVPVYEKLKWTGFDTGEESGRSIPLRPLVLTHANDGSGRTFVAEQRGTVHVIPSADAKETKPFLDLTAKVLYKDNENEQGLLGLAFHPKFKETGEFFVFYTDKAKRLENVVSRFRVSKDDPTQADPASEQELLRVSHRFWNHDGGTICFGPDGHLYVVLGDGGSADDPDDHGQRMDQLLGKILRIDVNAKGDTTAYAVPKDNPFVGVKDVRPEIYASGVRNPWRLTFDRKTGQGWFGEVGQNLWEEVNLLDKGANYGWRRRESLHPFGTDGVGPNKGMTDPVWEYHHDLGKSITGGVVYRGKKFPELDGSYLYADYVSGRIWALTYDFDKKRVVANRPISDRSLPVMSWGEDEAGEVYLMTYSANGRGIWTLAAKK